MIKVVLRLVNEQTTTLWGIPWDGTFAAALVAALVGILSWIFTGNQIRTVSKNAKRTEAFTRWDRGRELLRSENELDVEAGLNILEQLESSKHVNDEDRALAVSSLESYTRPRSTVEGGKK